MVVQIDDAGWGDLVGGCLLGFLRRETGEYIVKLIDVSHFRPPNFAKKTYLREALRLAREALDELKVSKDEEIEICTGSVLSEISYAALGVPRDTLPLESGRERFYALIRWVMEDFKEREKYVKTGWKSWNSKWRYWKPKKRKGL